MSYVVWKYLSVINKVILPKIYKKSDLLKLTAFDKAIVGWKIYVTYRYLDSAKSEGHDVI